MLYIQQLFHEGAHLWDMRWCEIAKEVSITELTLVISYPTSESGIIVSLETPP